MWWGGEWIVGSVWGWEGGLGLLGLVVCWWLRKAVGGHASRT